MATYDVEEIEPPTHSLNKGRWEAKRKIWLKDPDSLFAYAESVLGFTFAVGSGFVKRAPVNFPGLNFVILDDFQAEPFTQATGGAPSICQSNLGVAYDPNGWLLTLTYRSLEFDVENPGDGSPPDGDLPDLPDDTFLTVRGTMGMQMRTMDKDGMEWELANGDGSKDLGINVSVPKQDPTEQLQMSWLYVPLPPWIAMRQYRGCVNLQTFVGHDPETVMFIGADFTREYQINGARAWQIDYRFEIKESPEIYDGTFYNRGWNHFERPDPGAIAPDHQRIVRKDSAHSIYLGANFQYLFRAETAQSIVPPPQQITA